jgi:hypothetical protein
VPSYCKPSAILTAVAGNMAQWRQCRDQRLNSEWTFLR